MKREEFNALQHSHGALQHSHGALQHSHDALLLDYHGLEHLFHHHVQVSNVQHQSLEQMQRRDRLVVGTVLIILVFIVVYLNRDIFSLWTPSEL